MSSVKNVLVLGTSGSGKSSFINYLTESKDAEVSDTGESCTKYLKSYEAVIWGQKMRFFDTQGYNDTEGEMNETIASKIRNEFA